jgi:hypothetical protein
MTAKDPRSPVAVVGVIDDDLPQLRAPPSGRKSDAAFARSVAAAVHERRRPSPSSPFSRWWLGLPALAGAAAVAFVVVGDGGAGGADDAALARAVYASFADASGDVAAFDSDEDVLALATDDEGSAFAIPGLAGSSDGELEDIEAALDRRLKL